MSETNTAAVETTTVTPVVVETTKPAKKSKLPTPKKAVKEEKTTVKKTAKKSAKKNEVVRGRGRPRLYDETLIVKTLTKYKGTQEGLKNAWNELKKKYKDIAYMTVAIKAQKHKITFKAGVIAGKNVGKKAA